MLLIWEKETDINCVIYIDNVSICILRPIYLALKNLKLSPYIRSTAHHLHLSVWLAPEACILQYQLHFTISIAFYNIKCFFVGHGDAWRHGADWLLLLDHLSHFKMSLTVWSLENP
jgi:hypothetical protein